MIIPSQYGGFEFCTELEAKVVTIFFSGSLSFLLPTSYDVPNIFLLISNEVHIILGKQVIHMDKGYISKPKAHNFGADENG